MNRKHVPFRCDVEMCERKPYMEMYNLDEHSWSYLCRWHYILDRFKNNNNHGFCKVDTDSEILHDIRDTMEYLEYEVEEIRELIEKRE